MKKLLKDNCNCYEEIDRMINEGGHVDSVIWVKKANSNKKSDNK